MFFKHFRAVLVLAMAFIALGAHARAGVSIVNYDNIAITTNSGKPLTAEQVKQAIQVGAATKGWTISTQADGKLLATINVRNKHGVVLEISFTADKYSIQYKDSTNLNFKQANGQSEIHPSYNKWVLNLKEAIGLELLRL